MKRITIFSTIMLCFVIIIYSESNIAAKQATPPKKVHLSEPTPLILWQLSLKNALEANWVNHPKFNGLKLTEECHIYFKVLKNGSIESINIETNSGNSLLDETAMNAVKNAAPFGVLPEGMNEYKLIVAFSPKGLK